MRSRGAQSVLLVVAVLGAGGGAGAQPPAGAGAPYPAPTVTRPRVETHAAETAVLGQEVPSVLELTVTNSGGPGTVRVHAEQGPRRWEERAYFRAGEQRAVRLGLPGATTGVIRFGAEADPPPPAPRVELSVRPEAGRPGGDSWGRLGERVLIGGAAGLLIGLARLLGRSRSGGGAPTADPGPPPGTGTGESGVPVLGGRAGRGLCYLCGRQLGAGELASRVCHACRA